MFYGKPQFFGVRAAAANIGHSAGNYTVDDFRTDYPQFFNADGDFLGSLPMLEQIIQMANVCMRPTMRPCSCVGMRPATRRQSKRRPPGRWWAW